MDASVGRKDETPTSGSANRPAPVEPGKKCARNYNLFLRRALAQKKEMAASAERIRKVPLLQIVFTVAESQSLGANLDGAGPQNVLVIIDQKPVPIAQFSKVVRHLPTGTRGKERVDHWRDQRIVHVLKSGGRRADAPPEYGPRKTFYNRYVRWAAKGAWADLFQALAQARGPPEHVAIDSSVVKAHRSTAAE